MTETSTYYVTTPIYYVNDRPHIGHCYTTLVADVAARYERLRRGSGRDVFFLTGTDEHAEKVTQRAAENHCSPMEWATRHAEEFKAAYRVLDLAYDDFVRTTEKRHKDRASAYIARLMKTGDIELGDYEGWWDASQEEYLTETAAKEAGFVSPVTGKPLERRKEQNYFFRLDRYERTLLDLIDRGDRGEPDGLRIMPEARRNEVLGRIRGGLQPVPVSRRIKDTDADWGIRMPGDPAHRVYVWIEALCNYLTVVDNELEPATAASEGGPRRRFWPASVHFMAKDILWFHAVIWPAMLTALGEKPPRTVYAHAYWVRDGRKMSKSLGNFIEIETLEAYATRYSPDAVRWYMLMNGPLGATDADFSHDKFVEVYNADLANGVGNCASRVANMVEKYFQGQVPDVDRAPLADRFRSEHPGLLPDFYASLAECDLAGVAGRAISLVRGVDQFIAQTRPFSLAKQMDVHGKDVAGILYYSAEVLRIAALMLSAVMPGKMHSLLTDWASVPPPGVPLDHLCEFGGPHGLKTGQRLTKGEPLFMRADPAEPPPRASTT